MKKQQHSLHLICIILKNQWFMGLCCCVDRPRAKVQIILPQTVGNTDLLTCCAHCPSPPVWARVLPLQGWQSALCQALGRSWGSWGWRSQWRAAPSHAGSAPKPRALHAGSRWVGWGGCLWIFGDTLMIVFLLVSITLFLLYISIYQCFNLQIIIWIFSDNRPRPCRTRKIRQLSKFSTPYMCKVYCFKAI